MSTTKTIKTTSRDHDGWNSRSQAAARAGKHRQTLWRWQRAGLWPAPDGYDPHGKPLWRDSTIDRVFARDSGAT